MSYRNDQWFNLHNEAATGESLNKGIAGNYSAGAVVSGAGNAPFQYPDRVIRNADGSSRSPMKRGYIRSLAFGENKSEFSIQKCQFQFNPSQIAQSVQQNTAVLNFIQQDPAQYAQPMPGNVSFSFDLFFDRSAEINNNNLNNGAFSLGEIDTDNPWETGNPAEIGVLHDLSHLYRVIGVGVNSAMQEYLNKTAIAASNAQVEASKDDPDADTPPEFDEAEFNTDVETFMNYNVGNTAFLLPLPCRIVFSSLYIVEGLVKDINVLFTKFTETMVPMQCSVQVMFEAKYIGFAKKDTFFEYALRDLEQVEVEKPSPIEEQAYYEAVAGDLSQVKMVFINDGRTKDGEDQSSQLLRSDAYGRNFDWTSPLFTGDLEVAGAFHSRSLWGALSKEYSSLFGTPDNRLRDNKGAIKILFPKEANNRYLRSLVQNNGVNLTVSASGRLDVYRYTRNISGDDKTGFQELHPDLFANINKSFRGGTAVTDTVFPSGSEQLISSYANLRRVIENKRYVSPGDTGADVLLLADDGEEHRFKNAAHIMGVSLNSSNLGEGGIAEASNLADFDKMMESACVSSMQELGTPDNDISLDSSGGTRYYPLHNQGYFGYLARFQVTVSVTINNNTSTQTAVDYRLFSGPNDFSESYPGWLQKSINLNWPAPTPTESTTSTGGSGGSEDEDENDYPWDITGG